ncbi:protein-disulfide reductase DsbD family protein [Pseudodesulfovibrio tunisiensis]|uniref:protein-disulfide reductase DsbD family protein n=1 Tax=Pseudodesulfovibrio tunisiensis TaxID=463192 RepID=UPI001FB26761|nr:cytochrome c biogenesis protein CcdA [Pseudodesulfovibrio tunisiensis]
MTRKNALLISFPILFLLATTLGAVTPSTAGDLPLHTRFSVFSLPEDQAQRLENKAERLLTLTLKMDQGWYTYAHNPGGMGKPTRLAVSDATSGKAIGTLYPEGKSKIDPFNTTQTINTYESGTRLFIPLPSGVEFVTATLDLLLCSATTCLPASVDLVWNGSKNASPLLKASDQPWWEKYRQIAATTPLEATRASSPEIPSTSENAQWNFEPRYLVPGLEVSDLITAILLGLIAGLILNVMPCVLPVVSLKLSAILSASSEQDEKERQRLFREHNIFFALGVLCFFSVLALTLGLTGQAWGAFFQNRWLVLAVAGIILALSASLFGLFHLPVIDLKFGSKATSPRSQAFFTGMLTTLLATPCSGPFLGGVLSWALLQQPFVVTVVFLAIGAGMASPYLLMTIFPGLSRFLPRPGPWIEFVEKGIAFFLLATGFYLVSLALGSRTLLFLVPTWGIACAIWLWKRSMAARTARNVWKLRLTGACLAGLCLAWTFAPADQSQPWDPFDTKAFNQQLGSEVLFVDFTADWCPTCKLLEATVLTPDNVRHWKRQYDIRFIKADLTERNPDAEALLKALGGSSIPMAAVFGTGPAADRPLVLRDLFTKTQLENALESWDKPGK